MPANDILRLRPLGFAWETIDPFLFCVHHADAYPRGNQQFGPQASLAGRDLGQDFTPRDGWRMYHGEQVPGFPAHPHRGFETVTIVLNGFVDHSDSHGAAGRYGNGDVQWMTAGSGLQHAEMFPLLDRDNPNPLELFQIWLNLPAAKKFATPHYKMLWAEEMTHLQSTDPSGKTTHITLFAGELNSAHALAPAPDSWAADPLNEVAIAIIEMEAGAQFSLPAAGPNAQRTLYYFAGTGLRAAGRDIPTYHAIDLRPATSLDLQTGSEPARLLLLQGVPIAEPVVQYGPFVMNSQQEIRQAYSDYQRTEFGGWPWDRTDPVHPREAGRFARYANGETETRPAKEK
jgi:redox-sensitive bicupin YhaK (pirin superfamily)